RRWSSYSTHILSWYGSRDHRHLRSFPTRRSSDLNASPGKVCSPTTSSAPPPGAPGRRGTWSRNNCRASPKWTSTQSCTPQTWTRSEEHTSELQSRENLVCRLLLEKKKKQHR